MERTDPEMKRLREIQERLFSEYESYINNPQFNQSGSMAIYKAYEECDRDPERTLNFLATQPEFLKKLNPSTFQELKRIGVVNYLAKHILTKEAHFFPSGIPPSTYKLDTEPLDDTSDDRLEQLNMVDKMHNRNKFLQLFSELQQAMNFQELEKFRHTGSLPAYILTKFGDKFVDWIVDKLKSPTV